MNNVLTLILGGGRGTRLFPLTLMRSKPAVPIGGKYRLIDVPISNCLHAGLRRIFVLTQFNSASLNRHIAQTYRLDNFTDGFVEILAAEQTPEHSNWFQGTADAVRQAMRHFLGYEADYYLILAGDHLYRMDFAELIDAHIDSRADVTVAAQPIPAAESSAMGVFRFDHAGQIVGFEEKPSAARLAEIGSSMPPGVSAFGERGHDTRFVASMGIYVFSHRVLVEMLDTHAGVDFGREIIPASLDRFRVRAHFYRGYWADVGTIESFYAANILLTASRPPFTFYDPERPIYTHHRFLAPSRFVGCSIESSLVTEGCFLEACTIRESVVGIRSRIGTGSRIARSVVLSADLYEETGDGQGPQGQPHLGIGRNATLDRVIVDKNARIGDDARLVNEAGVQETDGEGYYIRGGVIVVPKGGVIQPGTVI